MAMTTVELLKFTLASVAINKEELKKMRLEDKVTKMESLVLKLWEDPKFCVDKESEVDCNNFLDLVLKEVEKEIEVVKAGRSSTSSNAN
ncbi:hypothetical protein RDI58_011408 [Solanum bulbocastanum]|uniref:Uncharacterized protein n=1 Tax=Solanum bulbocastanum TaxID=147425 RepID=A0AAN8YHA1_SOLBU